MTDLVCGQALFCTYPTFIDWTVLKLLLLAPGNKRGLGKVWARHRQSMSTAGAKHGASLQLTAGQWITSNAQGSKNLCGEVGRGSKGAGVGACYILGKRKPSLL